MASVITDPNGFHRVVFKGLDGKRRPIRLDGKRGQGREKGDGKRTGKGDRSISLSSNIELT